MTEAHLQYTIDTASRVDAGTYPEPVPGMAVLFAAAVIALEHQRDRYYTALIPLVPIQRQLVVSSNLAEVGYHADLEVLEVLFTNGGLYRYGHIPASTHQAFMAAESKGKYFHQHIRLHQPIVRLTPGQPSAGSG